MKRTLIRTAVWLVAIVGICAAIIYALRPTPVLVDIAEVRSAPLSVFVQDDGVTRIRERYVVSAPLTGRLMRVTLDVGDPVQTSTTVLARMQPTDPELLDPRAVAQAQARVSAAERRVEASLAEAAKAQVALDYAEKEMGRLASLRQQNAVSQAELDNAEFDFRARREDARAAGFNVDIAEYELQLQRAALLLTDTATPDSQTEPIDETANLDIPNTVQDMELSILSPINGRVLRIYQESTAVITVGSSLMELGDPTDLEVVVDVLSRDAVQIEAGDPVLLENWGESESLHGVVRRVEPSGFTKISALGVEEQRVNVIIDLNDKAENRKMLGDNFRVDAKIIVWQEENVLQLPTSALFRVNNQWNVFRVVDGIAVITPVEIGHNNGLDAEVLEGLEIGDQVIVHPGDSVMDGVTVADRARL